MIIVNHVIENPHSSSTVARDGMRCRKYNFDGGQVETAAELVQELDADGNQLRVVKLTEQAVPAPNGGARFPQADCSNCGVAKAKPGFVNLNLLVAQLNEAVAA